MAYLHEFPDGRVCEYRRRPSAPTVLLLECRLLRVDGTPHEDGWYSVSDAELLRLQLDSSDIVAALAAE